MIVLPSFKLLVVGIEQVYVTNCPWVYHHTELYLIIGLVFVLNLYQTIHIALVILVSKGWMFVRKILKKGDLSSLSLIMGITYVSYGAYFVTSQLEDA